MRSISDADWSVLFERMSTVDDILTPCGCYSKMDFPTRNLYRSAIEELARGSQLSETGVAKRAIFTAQKAVSGIETENFERITEPGYYLVAAGRRAFEKTIGYNPPPASWFARSGRALGIRGYAATGAMFAALLLALPLAWLSRNGVHWPMLALLGSVCLIPTIDLSVALVNWVATRTFRASALPAMDLRDGVPSYLRTLIAVPTLLTTRDAIEKQIEQLEIHHLASLEGELHFALLSDWTDSPTEHRNGDDELLAVATQGIARLNNIYKSGGGGKRFLLLHRHRVWNQSEQSWIGWERKRGKLHELNRLLRGASDTTYRITDGSGSDIPADVKYVLTLDSDTRLPRDTVRRLIGKMAHPLNAPLLDAAGDRVVEGYAVLQPRVTPSLPIGHEGSLFQRTFSSMNGIDPYDSAISDVYQDLFGEGSYAGKGIYDVDAFEAALAGRVPDSTLLSHDLFEGILAHAGLASDIEVVEEFPARYDVAASRNHRWARGDWQLLPWIIGRGGLTNAVRGRSAIPVMGRWKMLDNLRRSVSAPAAVLALLLGWTLPVSSAIVWTLFVLATIVMPTIIPIIAGLIPARPGTAMRSHFAALGSDLRLAFVQSGLLIALLAHQAWSMGDAIVRTIYRLLVSRRHLLEWTTAAQAATGQRPSLSAFYRQMSGALAIAVFAVFVSVISGSSTWPLAVPLALAWMASPALAKWISGSPSSDARLPVSDAEMRTLRLTARRTWRFFETFVTPADNMLPPDNFQEDPDALAHRTSPTNIGLYLLSVVSARDLGWIGTVESVERLEATLLTMSRLARFRGHFYNWYDTQDLRTLDPPYVSTVDSGNLAGHLIALSGACIDWAAVPVPIALRMSGILDSLDIAQAEAELTSEDLTQTTTARLFDDAVKVLANDLALKSADSAHFESHLSDWKLHAENIVDIANVLSIENGKPTPTDLSFWSVAVSRTIASHAKDLAENGLVSRLSALAATARQIAIEMEFGFLLETDRKLLSIGYLVPEGRLDENCYDLLASEARLASFLAIAKGDLPAKHWFRLGRAVTPVGSGAALISWSGSMFEYLMPSLVMRAPTGSLLEQTSKLIVRRQIDYAATLGVPWGISESAYNARNIELTYQYSNFGVPGLGLKRGLAANTVIAPYATALAAMVDPKSAVINFARMAAAGADGRYGFCEALDYTVGRVPDGSSVAIVRAFMAHHQGMAIVAIADTLLDGVMRSRFHSDPIVQATELLLQERTPRDFAIAVLWDPAAKPDLKTHDPTESGARRLAMADSSAPATQMLSNGLYSVLVTAAGSGFSKWGDLAITRWREDATCDDWGSYVFLRDVGSARFGLRACNQVVSIPKPTRSYLTKIVFSSRAPTARSRLFRTSLSRERTMRKCGAFRLPILAVRPARSISRRIRKSYWLRRPPICRIQRLRSCSLKLNSSLTRGRCWRLAAGGLRTNLKSGLRSWPCSMALL